MRNIFAVFYFSATFLLAIQQPAFAYPSSGTAVRDTGLNSGEDCTRRAFSAMSAANLGDIKVKGETKDKAEALVYAHDDKTIAWIACVNAGRTAVIFSASTDGNDSPDQPAAKVRDTIAQYMQLQR